MRVLSCGMKSPRDCFNCPHVDCVCNAMSTAEEGRWMRGTRRQPTKQEAPRRVTLPVSNDTPRREAKSNLRPNNYEFLFY